MTALKDGANSFRRSIEMPHMTLEESRVACPGSMALVVALSHRTIQSAFESQLTQRYVNDLLSDVPQHKKN